MPLSDPSRSKVLPQNRPTTGLPLLENLVPALRPGTLTVVAGRPGHGADPLLTQIICHNALDRKIPTLWFDGEVTTWAAHVRIGAARASIPRPRLLMNQLKSGEQQRFDQVVEALAQAPLIHHVATDPATVNHLDALIREAARAHTPPVLVGIDTRAFRDAHGESMPILLRHLRHLAGELGLAVVARTGVRQWHFRPNAAPRMSDLHDARVVRTHATTVIITDYPDARDPSQGRSPHELDLYLHPIAGEQEPSRVTAAYSPQCGQIMEPAPVN